MGIKELITKYRAKSKASGIRKNIARLADKHQLSENRYAAAEALSNDGSDAAIKGLLQRFNFTYDNSIKDKGEKEYVTRLVLGYGERSIPFIKEYIYKEENIAWPLKILGQLIHRDQVLKFLLTVLNDEDSTFKESVLEKRLDLLNYLAEFKDKEIVDKVISFLTDEEEEVRFKAIEVLGKQGDERAREPILKLFVDENESMRIRMKILEVFLATEWSVSGFRSKVEEMLPEGYYLTKDGVVKIRGNVVPNL